MKHLTSQNSPLFPHLLSLSLETQQMGKHINILCFCEVNPADVTHRTTHRLYITPKVNAPLTGIHVTHGRNSTFNSNSAVKDTDDSS